MADSRGVMFFQNVIQFTMTSPNKSDYIWAKSANNGEQWVPLWLHLRDTFQIAGWIWDNRIPKKHKNMLLDDLGFSEQEGKSLFMLLGGLHDLGKATPDFSGRETVKYSTAPLYLRMKDVGFSYQSYETNRGLDKSAIRHEIASEFYIKEFLKPENAKYTQDTILAIIAAHHGNPRSLDYNSTKSLQAMESNPEDANWLESMKEIFDFILEGLEDSRLLLEKASQVGISWRTQLVYAGYLSMADWLASSENNFPLWDFSSVETYSWDTHPERLENALSNIDFPEFFDPQKINIDVSIEEMFEKRFGFSTPRNVQKKLVELVLDESVDPSDIFILEAPMGEGKTEAALIASEILMKRSNSTGVFFGLPTMATGEAIYGRVAPYLESLLIDSSQNATLELAHSKSAYSSNREELQRKAYFNNKKHGIISSGWLSGRYLKTLNSFVVGTVDTFLMMQLKAKYGYWRHLGFSQKVIIIDEVHSMDETMKRYLEECLQMAGLYACPVILASATLKESERATYINAYIKGKNLGGKITHGKN